MFVCNMRRIIINWLLLVSLAAAVPGARHKRHLSYLTNLFSAALLGQDQDESSQLGYSDTEPKYKLYKVPGFDDILIKSETSAPVIVKTVLNNPGDVIEPFDTYIGTTNPQGSLVALQHVNNLLSTGILNGQQTNLLKETIVPMTSGINLIPQENIGPVPVISESIKPIQTDVLVNHYGEDDNLETFNPTYSYKQVEVTNPQVIVKEEIDQPANIPPCIDQTIDEVVEKVMPIGSYPIANGVVYEFPPSRSDEPFKIVIMERTGNDNLFNQAHNPKEHPSNNKNVELTANKEPVHRTASRYGNKQASHNNSNNVSMVSVNVNNGSSLLNHNAHNPSNTNTTPVGTKVSNIEKNPEELEKNKENAKNGGERVTEAVPPKGTLSYYIYEHERNKPKPFSKVEADQHKSDVNNPNSIRYVYIPPDYNKLAKEDLNIAKTADHIVPADNAQKDAGINTTPEDSNIYKNGISVNVNGMSSKGRGDIPGE